MIFSELTFLYSPITNVIDILLVYLLIYRILSWLKDTHAYDLIKGFSVIALFFLVCTILNLDTLKWLIEKFTAVLIILVFIIFQPELRRFLERIGSTGDLFNTNVTLTGNQSSTIIKTILRTIDFLAKEKIGAIIAIERLSSLEEYIASGIPVKGNLNSEILSSLFWPGSPTHDGAVIIRKDTIQAAGCFLPLTTKKLLDRSLGTRHRAALGLSEASDAFIIIVSEETGVISLIEDGNMTRFLNREALETRLFTIYSPPRNTFTPSPFSQLLKWFNLARLFTKR